MNYTNNDDYRVITICTPQPQLVEPGRMGAVGRPGLAGRPGPAGVSGPPGSRGLQGETGATLDSVHFKFQAAQLLSECQSKIGLTATWTQRDPSTDIELMGYLDQREVQNRYSWNGLAYSARRDALSDLRDRLVPGALIVAELEQTRVRLGSGDGGRFLCSEATESCWQQNRRVEAVVAGRAAH